MHGLDEYDSEARWFYPAIVRTTTIDPHAENYYSTSPYAWCANNPVRMVDPDGMDWYSYEEKYKDKDGKEQTRTAYKYVAGQMSEKEMEKGGFTHLGLTYTDGNNYYSLFGSVKNANTKEGEAYKIIDEAIIKHASHVEKILNDPNYDGRPTTDFSLGNNESFNIRYENSISGIVRLHNVESNNAYMEEWITSGTQPKVITGFVSADNRKLYHILLRTSSAKRQRDVVHIKFTSNEAQRLIQIYYQLFPNSKSKRK